jgi:prolipoprotein diacylglyceryltransferase
MPLAFVPSPASDLVHLGPVPVRLQALFIVAGIAVAIAVAERRYRARGGRPGVIMDIAAWAVPAGVLPAAAGSFLAPARSGFWQGVRAWDAALGFGGAAALGGLAAWAACRRMSGRARPARRRAGRAPGRSAGREEIRLREVAAAAAPAIAFGYALAVLGDWAAQQGYGKPSSLWWAVEITPAHRLPGYENFATFQPLFGYRALWAVTAGIGLAWLIRRLALPGDEAIAVLAACYGACGFALLWLGIGHLPVVLGPREGELGDAAALAGAAAYLARALRKRAASRQGHHNPALERDSPVM